MKLTVGELAALVEGRVAGDADVIITGFAGIDHAGPGDATFVAQEKYLPLVAATRAAVVVVAEVVDGCPATQIIVRDPNLAFARAVAARQRAGLRGDGGRHPRAVIHPTVVLGADVAVGACAVIEAGATVGARTVIGAGVYIGAGATIGSDCLLHPQVVVLEEVRVGDRVILHAGAVLGADGFGFATDEQGTHHKIPQIGTVVIEDDVELGANTCIDRARFRETRIGRGTKIDNLVQVGHNVIIGPHSIIVAHCGIAGSSELGQNVVLGAMVGVGGHVHIGDRAQVAAMSGVNRSIDGDERYIGVPVTTFHDGQRSKVVQRRLPEMEKALKDAVKRIAALELQLARASGAKP